MTTTPTARRQADHGTNDPANRPMWTAAAVRQLGLTTTVERAAEILGISRTTAYALAKDDKFPVDLIRIGRRYLVPTTALLELLGARHGPYPEEADAATT